jgi:DNA polymerase
MTEMRCYFDIETKSECNLKAHGTHRYAEHPSTDIQLFAYALDEGEVKIWDRECGEPMPADLKAAFRNKDVIFWAHNTWFDRNLIENVLKIKLPIERYRCSMAAALSHGLPGSLDALGKVLGIAEDSKKIKDGKRLVLKFCKPKKDRKTGELKWATPLTDTDDWAAYKEYCNTDVIAMREIIRKIPQWNYPANPTELKLWFKDQIVNSRGMNIDLELSNAAMLAIESAQTDLAASTKDMTNGEVDTAGQRDKMIQHITEQYGCYLPDMKKASLQRIVDADETPDALRDLLVVRLSTCTTSTSKYKRLVNATSTDGRLRGAIQFSGAGRTQRSCLAEGSLVTVLTKLGMIEEKPIETVDKSDLVWDGGEWVSHDGVEFSGEKEVIWHDGVCATPEHIVYLDATNNIRLGEAKEKDLKIWVGNKILDDK